MKKNFFYVALSALALVACTNDEVVDVNPGKTVEFSATTGKMTRSGVETTTNTITDFKVWAYQNGKVDGVVEDGGLFFETVVTKENGEWTYNNGNPYFWPEYTNPYFNFYSISPLPDEVNLFEGGIDMENHKISFGLTNMVDDVPAGVDLLYAVNTNVTKETNNGVVDVNFRHALSQVVFKVKNTNPNLKVEVNAISIVRAKDFGVLTLPTLTTKTTNINEVYGTWDELDILDPNEVSYGIRRPQKSVEITNAVYEVEDRVILEGETAAVDFEGYYKPRNIDHKSLFMIPQTFTPSPVVDGKMNLTEGTYFAIDCVIFQKINNVWNIQWGDVENLAGPGIIPSKTVAIPACKPEGYTWQAGKKYVYTIVFGDGAGFVGDDPTDEEAEPTLIPITFDVTVDEFQDGGSYDVDLDTDEYIND